ncbi:hypothetical protein [Agromyces humi]|uniref:hypothetical protein n=1 Tax=Agromyces humi TaxID=1766800 RepID=UPI00135904FA|nr:hypothetical protein [Agromyces humi]
MSNIIHGLSDLPSVDLITPDGIAAADRHFAEVSPSTPAWQRQMILEVAARDWSHGEEERVLKQLRHYLDLTGTLRVVAAMVSASVPPAKPAPATVVEVSHQELRARIADLEEELERAKQTRPIDDIEADLNGMRYLLNG